MTQRLPTSRPRRLAALAVALGLACGAVAAPASSAEGRADTPTLQGVVADLGHHNYAVRAVAQDRLFDLPEAQQRRLGQVYLQSDDPEVAVRLRMFAHDYFDRRVLPEYDELRRRGFLGVSQTVVRRPDGGVAIRVVKVVDGTGAEEAGVEPNDLIVALDGEGVDPRDPVGEFSEAIKAKGEGERVTLTLIRDGVKRKIEATLGPLPSHMDTEARRLDLKTRRLRDHWFERAFLKGKLRLDQRVNPGALLTEDDLADGGSNGNAPAVIRRNAVLQPAQGARIQIELRPAPNR